MLKMMKYEYRRGIFPLLVVITALAAAELLFLIGIFAEKDLLTGLGITFLVLGGWASFMFVLIYGVIIYSQDLKNKTGYMVFMTPISNLQDYRGKAAFNPAHRCDTRGLSWTAYSC